MISDVLSEAVMEIDRYLDQMPDVYWGDGRRHVERVRDEMETLRRRLDTPPPPTIEPSVYSESDTRESEMERVAKIAERIRQS